MNVRNTQKRFLRYLTIVMVICMALSSITVFADQTTQVPETTQDEIGPKTQISYDSLSTNKVESEPYNQNAPVMLFDKYEEKKLTEYCFFVRVEEDGIKSFYGDSYSSFIDKVVVEYLYREKTEGAAENEGWKAGTAQGVYLISKKADEETGKNYIYLAVDAYDGGMKDLEVGKNYEIILEFYEKTETTERKQICATQIIDVKYTSQMKDAWRSFFAARAGVDLTEEGKIDEAIFTGWMDVIKVPMGWLMKAFYALTNNYLLAIFLFAVVIKIILFPTGIKQQKNMVKQAKFAPKQRAIQNRYKGRTDRETQLKMQQEIQEAQQKEGISMMGGGCLSMILQMLILLALYGVIREPLTYMSNISLDAMAIIRQYFIDVKGVTTTLNDINVIGFISENFEELSAFLSTNFSFDLESLISTETIPNFVLFKGFNMADSPSIKEFNLLLLIPVLVFVSYYFSMKITRKLSYQPPKIEGAPDAMASMKIMDITMPAMSAFICFSVPAMLGIYWMFQSLIGIVQQYILKKMYPFPVYSEEDYKAAEREYKGKLPKEKEKKKEITQSSKRSITKYDDDEDEYAVLDDKPSYYDLPKSEREKIEETKKASQKKESNKMIEKPEMDKEDKDIKGE